MRKCELHGEECPSNDGPTCAECGSMVDLQPDADWDCWDICWQCGCDRYRTLLAACQKYLRTQKIKMQHARGSQCLLDLNKLVRGWTEESFQGVSKGD